MAGAVSDEAWAEIERAYSQTTESQNSIAKRTGVFGPRISERAKHLGWTRPPGAPALRPKTAPAAIHSVDTVSPGEAAGHADLATRMKPRPKTGLKRRETIRQRVIRLADRNLDFLEELMEQPDKMEQPAERERATKTLDFTVRMLEKLDEPSPNDQRANAASDQSAAASVADLERRRNAVAERLERIMAKRAAETGSGGVAG